MKYKVVRRPVVEGAFTGHGGGLFEAMSAKNRYDVIVIGGGPARLHRRDPGRSAGHEESRASTKTDALGGTCLRVGCIPSKALLESSQRYVDAQDNLAEHGIKVSDVELDLPAVLRRKDKVVTTLTRGIDFLLKKNKVDRIRGRARLDGPGRVTVDVSDGDKTGRREDTVAGSGAHHPRDRQPSRGSARHRRRRRTHRHEHGSAQLRRSTRTPHRHRCRLHRRRTRLGVGPLRRDSDGAGIYGPHFARSRCGQWPPQRKPLLEKQGLSFRTRHEGDRRPRRRQQGNGGNRRRQAGDRRSGARRGRPGAQHRTTWAWRRSASLSTNGAAFR